MATMDMSIQLRPHPEVLTQPTIQSVILLHLHTDRFYELNQTAGRFWELLNTGHNLAEIQACMLADYDVDEAQLADEIADIVTMMRNEGLVIIDE
jgi:hypothetical protein